MYERWLGKLQFSQPIRKSRGVHRLLQSSSEGHAARSRGPVTLAGSRGYDRKSCSSHRQMACPVASAFADTAGRVAGSPAGGRVTWPQSSAGGRVKFDCHLRARSVCMRPNFQDQQWNGTARETAREGRSKLAQRLRKVGKMSKSRRDDRRSHAHTRRDRARTIQADP